MICPSPLSMGRFLWEKGWQGRRNYGRSVEGAPLEGALFFWVPWGLSL